MADGVNVGYDVYRIDTEVTAAGRARSTAELLGRQARPADPRRSAGSSSTRTSPTPPASSTATVVNPRPDPHRDPGPSATSCSPSIFPGRKEVPKTLIFAKDDSHAEDIVQIVREEFGRATSSARRSPTRRPAKTRQHADRELPQRLQPAHRRHRGHDRHRHRHQAAGMLLFMRDVRSRGYFEQMKGRGVRSLDARQPQARQQQRRRRQDPLRADRRGGRGKVAEDRKPSAGEEARRRAQGPAARRCHGSRDDDTVLSLGNRLVRLAKQLDDKAWRASRRHAAASPLGDLAQGLVAALDPDAIVADALDTAKAAGITRNEDTLTADGTRSRPRRSRDAACCAVRRSRTARLIESARREREQTDRPYQPRPGHASRASAAQAESQRQGHASRNSRTTCDRRRNRSAGLLLPTALPAPQPHLRHDRRPARRAVAPTADAHHRTLGVPTPACRPAR